MINVCVQGLGFVGAAMATAIASSKDDTGTVLYNVIGVDLPSPEGQRRIDSINSGKFPFTTNDDHLKASLATAHSQKNISATSDEDVYQSAKIIVVDIPLDIPYLDDEPQLDFSGFKQAIRVIGQKASLGALIIVETTVPPGTCDEVVIPTLKEEIERRNLDFDQFHVAHSYERVMPGDDYLNSITNYWRVFAGYTPKASDLCEGFLSTVVNTEEFPLTRLSSMTASETAKVMENTYRAVNIAFIDEWTKFSEEIGIDMYEVTQAIRMRPTHSNIRFPGLGVGGYCLTKDPTFAPAAAKQIFGKELNFPFSKLAVETNHRMPLHTVDRLQKLLNGSLESKRILVCGVSYRPEVGDTRYSPSEVLVRELLDKKVTVICHDPYVDFWPELEMEVVNNVPETEHLDAVIFAVSHEGYASWDAINWIKSGCLILDANGVLPVEVRNSAREKGLVVETIGRADGQ